MCKRIDKRIEVVILQRSVHPAIALSDFGIEIVAAEHWSARLELCQWRRETLDKESIWPEGRSTSLSRW